MKTKIRNIFILLVLIFISVYYNSSLKERLLVFEDLVLSSVFSMGNYVKDKISLHFNQAKQIAFLRAQNLKLQYKAELSSTFANELNRLLEDKNSSAYFPKLELVKALSYLQLSDYTKFWLDAPLYDGKIRGLISHGYTAGIAVPKDGRALALMQYDKACMFSVYIGKSKATGIIYGNKKNMIIKYIPRWMSFKIGDEVYTSGLDNIFFSGVLVGKITKIIDLDAYKNAIVEPFLPASSLSYLYMIQSI